MKKHDGNGSRGNASRKNDKRSSNGRSSRGSSVRLNHEWLQNFLSEMLAVERGGVKLYAKALEELEHKELRPKLEQFHQQTERHVELCEELLNASGGKTANLSPGAQAAEHKARGLMTAKVPEEMVDSNNIENLVLAETKDHWNWETLGSLIEEIEDPELKKTTRRAVREVLKQENDHVGWNEKTLTRLATAAAHQTQDMKQQPEQTDKGEPSD